MTPISNSNNTIFIVVVFSFIVSIVIVDKEFKKLRRLLQRGRDIKTELCAGLSVMRLFQVGHSVQTRRSVLSLAWHEEFSCQSRGSKIYCCELALSSETSSKKISRRRLADYVKKLHQKKACRTCSTVILTHSTNEIIDFWRCRCS